MVLPVRLLLIAFCTLTACGPQPLTTDRSGALQVAAVCAPDGLTAALQQHGEATLVVAPDAGDADVMAAVAAAA